MPSGLVFRTVCGPRLLTTDLTAYLEMLLQMPRPLHSAFFFLTPLLLPHTYQLLRLVLILSLSCLYLAVHTKTKPVCPRSINAIAQLFHFFFYTSALLLSCLHLNLRWSFLSPLLDFLFLEFLVSISKATGRLHKIREYKHLTFILFLSRSQWGSFLSHDADILNPNILSSCGQVNQREISDIVVICFWDAEREERHQWVGEKGVGKGKRPYWSPMCKARQTLKGQSYTINDTLSLSY